MELNCYFNNSRLLTSLSFAFFYFILNDLRNAKKFFLHAVAVNKTEEIESSTILILGVDRSFSFRGITPESIIKNLLKHSQNFLLPYITVEKYFIIIITFIFNLYFLYFVVK